MSCHARHAAGHQHLATLAEPASRKQQTQRNCQRDSGAGTHGRAMHAPREPGVHQNAKHRQFTHTCLNSLSPCLQCCIYASLQRTMLLTLHSHCSTSGMSTGRILSRSRRAGVMRPATTASRSPDTSGQKVNVSHLSRSYAVFKPSQGCQCSPQTSPTHRDTQQRAQVDAR